MQITIREPGSALTHFIAMILAVFATIPLLIKAAMSADPACLTALIIFMSSMILLYGASTTYHSLSGSETLIRTFRKIDHMMIFLLIAGSYTPVCLTTLKGTSGTRLLVLIWGLAITGMILKIFWITCPKWFSSILYIAMGWACLLVFRPLFETLGLTAFLWLLAGGIFYTAGGVIYALRLSCFNAKHRYFGSHEIFHLFVMAGSICHFIFMYFYVA